MPTSALTPGMTATGWTVSQGTEPEPFSVEILGVLPNGVGPGRNMIIVSTDSPAITKARGIWFGMSGSPVYIGDRLVGVIAFGLSAGPSKIGGLTPAQDLVNVLAYPAGTASAGARAAASLPGVVKLSTTARRAIAAETGADVDDIGNLVRLKVPVSVSGLSERGMTRVNKYFRAHKVGVLPYVGSSVAAGAQAGAAEALEPGDNFAAALSYGDVTAAGVGTTSYVCDGKALAFGHPFLWTGGTAMGANTADAITIVDDPLFGPYKLANLTGGLGRVDQDRLAAVRTVFGNAPPSIPVRSTVQSLDTGLARDGATDVVFTEFGFLPFMSFLHLFTNIDTTFDEIGPGSARLWWSVQGTREDGRPWSFARLNYHVSDFDISIDTGFELWMKLAAIDENPLEDVRITNVEMKAWVEDRVKQYTISKVLVSQGRGKYREVRSVHAPARSLLKLRIVLLSSPEKTRKTLDMTLRVPGAARRGGVIEIAGAPPPQPICFPEEPCEGGPVVDTFDKLLRALSPRRNNVLVSKLRVGYPTAVYDRKVLYLDRYVRGSKLLMLNSAECCPEGEGGSGEVPAFILD
jgi:hypothetical protein